MFEVSQIVENEEILHKFSSYEEAQFFVDDIINNCVVTTLISQPRRMVWDNETFD